MPLTRRELLKFTAALPLLHTAAFRSFSAIQGVVARDHADILLRGLFFMEYQTDKNLFIVASPKHDKHCFLYRDNVTPHSPGAHSPLPNVMAPTTLKKGAGPNGDPFSPEILHFSCKEISHTGPFIDVNSPTKYACVLKLPYPKHIIPLRCGSFDDFHPNSLAVAKSIGKHCSGRIATVVWLRYDVDPARPPAFGLRTCYAEHGFDPNPVDVNCALRDAQKVFPKFDLQIVNGIPYGSKVLEDLQSQLPNDIDPRDEDALVEVGTNPCNLTAQCPQVQTKVLEVANCPILGVMP